MNALYFEWDDENVDHLARHGSTPDEVEEIFQRQVLRRRGGTDARDRYEWIAITSGALSRRRSELVGRAPGLLEPDRF